MKKINKQGFTLIELLVVIAIIGLLSTMAVVSLNSARQKARDARRISDVKQLTTILSLAASDRPDAVLQCGGSACGAGVNVATVTGSSPAVGSPNLSTEFDKFSDPSGSTVMCAIGGSAPCQYSFQFAANSTQQTVASTTILFYQEAANSSNNLVQGVNRITTEGIINP